MRTPVTRAKAQMEMVMRQLRRYVVCCVAGALLFTLAPFAWGDTVILKDGKVLQGTFKGGDATNIQFEVDGKVQSIAVATITNLTFSPREQQAAGQPAAPSAPVAAAAPAAASAAATVAAPASAGAQAIAGSKFMVKLDKDVSTASNPTGSQFSGLLETNLLSGDKTVAAKGTVVYGTVVESRGGKRVGGQRILLTFTSLNINGQLIPIQTDDFGAEGAPGGAARKVGAAALIGGAIDGGEGAAKGAAVGAAVALLAPGNHIKIPAGTLVEVTLKSDVKMP